MVLKLSTTTAIAVIHCCGAFSIMEFYNMQTFPKVATDLKGNKENFSVPVLVFDEENPDYFEIGHYNFDSKEWNHLGDVSIKLICWCYPPNPTEFLKEFNNWKSEKHIGYRD